MVVCGVVWCKVVVLVVVEGVWECERVPVVEAMAAGDDVLLVVVSGRGSRVERAGHW